MKQHRTLATYLNLLIAAGFTIRRVEEWGASREQIAAHPEWKIDHRRPSSCWSRVFSMSSGPRASRSLMIMSSEMRARASGTPR